MITKIKRELVKSGQLYLLLLPMIIWYGFFIYKPMWGLLISFKDYSIFSGFSNSPWIGWENFEFLFNEPTFWRAFINTIILSVYGLIFGFPIPIILAILLWELKNVAYRKLIQTVVYLPHFISIVIVSGLILTFLAPNTGVINLIIEKFGFSQKYFMIIPEWFRTIFISSNIWQSAGFSSIVYFAAIVGINPALYEAAKLDGANKVQQIRHVTIPCIMPTIIIMFIISIGHIMDSNFEKIILLYQPATYSTADTLGSYVYRIGLESAQYGPATAAGLFNALIALVLVISANKISKKLSTTSLW